MTKEEVRKQFPDVAKIVDEIRKLFPDERVVWAREGQKEIGRKL